MSLLNEPTLPERQRAQEANHIRTTDVQMLDALLRIEELLSGALAQLDAIRQPPVVSPTDFVPADGFYTAPGGITMVTKDELRGNYEGRHTPDTKKQPKKNPRSL